jgi:hypothetical protein
MVSNLMSKALDPKHAWYIDYRNDDLHYVIFKDKVFKIDRSQSDQYKEVKRYGISQGIPDYQLDFSFHITEWNNNIGK